MCFKNKQKERTWEMIIALDSYTLCRRHQGNCCLASQSGFFLLSAWKPLFVGMLAYSQAILGTTTKG